MPETFTTPLLQRPAKGQDVINLQSALASAGAFNGDIDGAFGPATEAAVKAFQARQELPVCGALTPATAGLLNWTRAIPPQSRLPQVTIEVASQAFGPAARANIEINLPFLLNALVEAELADYSMVAMAIATIRVEASLFLPVSELRSAYNTSPDGKPFDLYDRRPGLGNLGAPDGERFRGRGFIQLTGRANYERLGHKLVLGDMLIKDPFAAHDSQIAARLLAAFLKGREGRIRSAFAADRLTDARKLVNGGSNGLAEFIAAFKLISRLLPRPLNVAA